MIKKIFKELMKSGRRSHSSSDYKRRLYDHKHNKYGHSHYKKKRKSSRSFFSS